MTTLNEFKPSLETTRQWLGELMKEMNTEDEAYACRALRFTLQELREHLPPAEGADLASQFPLIIKGLFYEGWRPAAKREKSRYADDFLAKLSPQFKELSDEQIEMMVQDVFVFLSQKVSAGEIEDVVQCLPKELRDLWPQPLTSKRTKVAKFRK